MRGLFILYCLNKNSAFRFKSNHVKNKNVAVGKPAATQYIIEFVDQYLFIQFKSSKAIRRRSTMELSPFLTHALGS